MELSKSQKVIARQLISEALQRECKTFLEEVKDILPLRDQTPHEVYLNLKKKSLTSTSILQRNMTGCPDRVISWLYSACFITMS